MLLVATVAACCLPFAVRCLLFAVCCLLLLVLPTLFVAVVADPAAAVVAVVVDIVCSQELHLWQCC